MHLREPSVRFDRSHLDESERIGHLAREDAPDVEMMCDLYCVLLYDHIVINVNPPPSEDK